VIFLGAKRKIGKIAIRSFEETAFLFETFRVPKLQRKQENLIKGLYKSANLIRKDLGEKPKQYISIRKRKVVKF